MILLNLPIFRVIGFNAFALCVIFFQLLDNFPKLFLIPEFLLLL